jgi:hypothetical protein
LHLPAKTELVRNVLAGQSLCTGQGLFHTGTQAIAQSESEVGIAQEFAQAIVDHAAHEIFELFLGQLGQVHDAGGYEGTWLKCNWQTAVNSSWMADAIFVCK